MDFVTILTWSNIITILDWTLKYLVKSFSYVKAARSGARNSMRFSNFPLFSNSLISLLLLTFCTRKSLNSVLVESGIHYPVFFHVWCTSYSFQCVCVLCIIFGDFVESFCYYSLFFIYLVCHRTESSFALCVHMVFYVLCIALFAVFEQCIQFSDTCIWPLLTGWIRARPD